LSWKTKNQLSSRKWFVDASLNQYDNILDLKPIEFYFNFKFSEPLDLDFGQKREVYSVADEKWSLGLWQPVYQRDLLNPQTMGMIGAHLRFRKSAVDLQASYLPVFLPNINPEKSSSDNQIKSQGRWFRPLNQEIDFIGKKTDVRYSIGSAKTEEMLLQNSLLLRAALNLNNERLKISASAANKPINEPQFKYSGRHILSEQNKDFFEAQVSPVVFRHQVYNLDLTSQLSPGWFTYVSFGADEPEKKKLGFSTNSVGFQAQQKPESLRYESFGFNYKNDDFCYLCELDISYIKTQSEPVIDVDQDGKKLGSILPNRSIYSQAVRFSPTFRNQIFGLSQDVNMTWIRDLKLKGQILKLINKMRLTKSMSLSIGFDAIGVDDESELNESSFFNQFRANDRYFMGLGYVF
jgi:hypothetical protein